MINLDLKNIITTDKAPNISNNSNKVENVNEDFKKYLYNQGSNTRITSNKTKEAKSDACKIDNNITKNNDDKISENAKILDCAEDDKLKESNIDDILQLLGNLIDLLKVYKSDISNDNIKISSQDMSKVTSIDDMIKNLSKLLQFFKNQKSEDLNINDSIKNELLNMINFEGESLNINSDKIQNLLSEFTNLQKLNLNSQKKSNTQSENINAKDIAENNDLGIKDAVTNDIKIQNIKQTTNINDNMQNFNNSKDAESLINDIKDILSSIKESFNIKNENFETKQPVYQSNKENYESDFLSNLVKDSETDVNAKLDSKIHNIVNVMSKINNSNDVQSIIKPQNITINKNNLVQDIVKTISYMEINSIKNLTVKVIPEGLGEIVISMASQDGKLKLAMNASNKDTFNLLNANISDMSDKLASNNVKIQPSAINIYNEDASFFANQFGGQGFNQNSQKNNYNSMFSQKNNIQNDTEVLEDNNENDNTSNINKLV